MLFRSIVNSAGLPVPFDRLVASNMTNQVFEAQGYHTVSEYFGYSVTNVVVNIFSFLIIYVIARVVIALIVNAYNYASPLPVLRRFDSCAGGAVGLLRGFLGMFALFLIVPVVLISLPSDFVTPILNASPLATFFYHSNFLLNFISGTI